MKKIRHIYILSCSKDGGVYHYILSDGKIELVDSTQLDRPMYSVVHENKLYVVLRSPFQNSQESGVVYFELDENGKLAEKSEIMSTKGIVGCHIYVSCNGIYVTNYTSGSIVKLNDKIVVHKGNSINKDRQSSAHPHYVGSITNSNLLFVTDLGIDKIFVYDKNLDYITAVDAVSGTGPRHLVFSENGRYIYCANELSSTVAIYEYDGKAIKYIREYSSLPTDFKGKNQIAAIRQNNEYIYVSNRGHNSIACFKITGEELVLKNINTCGGDSPRDFNIVDNYLICANENDGNFVVFELIDNVILIPKQSEKIKNALCVAVKE